MKQTEDDHVPTQVFFERENNFTLAVNDIDIELRDIKKIEQADEPVSKIMNKGTILDKAEIFKCPVCSDELKDKSELVEHYNKSHAPLPPKKEEPTCWKKYRTCVIVILIIIVIALIIGFAIIALNVFEIGSEPISCNFGQYMDASGSNCVDCQAKFVNSLSCDNQNALFCQDGYYLIKSDSGLRILAEAATTAVETEAPVVSNEIIDGSICESCADRHPNSMSCDYDNAWTCESDFELIDYSCLKTSCTDGYYL